MIYDCFSFYNELDLLEIRLETLYDIVDRFIIVEASKTHRGAPKKLFFRENEKRYLRFRDKITYIIVNDFPSKDEHVINRNGDDWTLENWQRHCIIRGLDHCQPDDIIIVSDLDEIPKPKTLLKICKNLKDEIVALEMEHYNFFLNFLTNQPPGPAIRVLRYKTFQSRVRGLPLITERIESILPCYRHCNDTNKLRSSRYDTLVKNAAWHFSYLGNLEIIIAKANSIVEYSSTSKIDPHKTASRIYNGRDIYFRGYVLRPIFWKKSLPLACRRDERFAHLFYRAPALHQTLLFVQFFLFQAGMSAERLLKFLHMPTTIIHRIRKLLPA